MLAYQIQKTAWLHAFLLLLVVSNPGLVSGQIDRPFKEYQIDSLEDVLLQHHKNDEAKIVLLNQLAAEYSNSNFDKGISTGDLSIALAEKLNKPLLLAEAYHCKALSHTYKGDYDVANELFERALAINEKENNPYGIAQNTFQLGDLARRKGDYKLSQELFEKSLSLFQSLNDPEGIAKSFNGIAVFLTDSPKALDYYEKAFKLNEEIGNRNGMAADLNGMGMIYNRISDLPKARSKYDQAISLAKETGNQRRLSTFLANLGLLYQRQSDYSNALNLYQQALEISQKLGDQNGISFSIGNLGAAYSELSNFPKALECYQEAFRISEKLGNKASMAQNYSRIGNIYGRMSDELKSREFHQKALAIHQQSGNKMEMGLAYMNIGLTYFHLQQYPLAIEYYQKADTLLEQSGNKIYLAPNKLNLGAAYTNIADYVKAEANYQQALSLFKETGNQIGVAKSLGNLGIIYRDAPDGVLSTFGIQTSTRFTSAISYLNQQLEIGKAIGSLSLQQEALGNLAKTYELKHDFSNAYSSFQKFIIIRDSIVGDETKQKITRLEMQHEFDEKEAGLVFQQQLTDEQLAKQQLINKQQNRIYLLGLIAFLGVLGLLVTRLRYARKKQQLLQQQKEIEQREAERLTELDKLKTNLYTTITHEFRTPLTLILGPARKLLKKINHEVNAETVSNLNLIEHNGQRLLSLVNQILDLQKLEAKKLGPQYEQGDIMLLFHYFINSFQSLAERKNILLDFTCKPDSLIMDYDRDKLQKICSNLFANAIKFTPDSGAIRVTAEQKDNWLEVAVIDTGIGIPKENIKNIFTLFYQVDNTSTRGQDGSGIGLTLVKDLVELLGGRIQVESTLDKGSVFRFSLPIRQEAQLSENGSSEYFKDLSHVSNSLSIQNATLVAESNDNVPLILIIEDHPDVARYLGSCLEETYRIEYAVDGRKGIDLAIELVPDIIISDVMMPGADGFEVCRFLKEDARTSHIPIILLTALSDVKDRLEGLRRGADAYLTKPFLEEELLVTVEKLLQLRKILRDRFSGWTIPTEITSLPSSDLIALNKGETELNFDLLMEDAFMLKVLEIINRNLEDNEFTVEHLNREMGMSNTQLFRKLKALTNLSANQLIRFVRLGKAKELLRNSSLTIAEVAYQTGFTDPSYFSRIFSREVGMSPTEFIG